MEKICKRCGDSRPITSFSKHKGMRSGRLNVCGRCRARVTRRNMTPEKWEARRAKYRLWFKMNREKALNAGRNWRRKYPERHKRSKFPSRLRRVGLTEEQYDRILLECGNKCQICGGNPDGRWKTLHMDHDHKTGKFRGLLCVGCNRAIGFMNDCPEKAQKIAEYLKKHGGHTTNGEKPT